MSGGLAALRGRSGRALLASLAAVVTAAGVGGAATGRSVDTWYRTLDKPSFTPPDRAFGPVWAVLYAAQAVAAWLVWREGGEERRPALALYGAQLLLNTAWSLLFFGLRRPAWALVEIAVLWVAVAATLAAFWRRSRVAGALLVPYLAWLSLAAAINWSVWRRNR